MKKVQFTETVLRDANQSLIATRLGYDQFEPILDTIDKAGFYSSADYIGHVGIYIGNNRFIHSSTYTTGVIISELGGYYNTRGFIARRVA